MSRHSALLHRAARGASARRIAVGLVLLAAAALGQPSVTHGPIAGDPLPDTISIWVRASGPAVASVQYATNAALLSPAETAPVTLGAATDFCARFDITGLAPGTLWHYRVKLVDPAPPQMQAFSAIQRFKTAPAPGVAAPLLMAFGADAGDLAQFGIFASIAALQPDAMLMLGDWPYADSSPAATTLAAYRTKHKDLRAHPAIQSLFAAAPIIPIWDDHEISNDWDAGTSASLVQLGRGVWKEFMPVRPSGDAVWRSLRFGSAVEFFVLDTRTYRGLNAAPDLPGKTLLGTAQLNWLLAGLASSTATFKVVVSSVPLRYGTTNKDHWQGAMRERALIFDAIAAQRIPNVVVLSGDQHWSAVHHHREGIKEVQACPLAAGLRAPPAEPEPQVLSIWPVYSFGTLRFDPAASPPSLQIDIRDSGGAVIGTETIPAAGVASARLFADAAGMRARLDGPHRAENRGRETRLPYLPSGTYTVRYDATSPHLRGSDAITVPVPAGGFLAASAASGIAPDPLHPVLFESTFDRPDLSAWTVVDEGTIDAPSAWFVDDFELVQSSNIYGGSTAGTDPDKPGTALLAGDPAWTDVTLSFRVKTHDDDGIGALVRVAPDGSSYRFLMDRQRNYRRLVKRVGGISTTLAEVAAGYETDHWIQVEIRAIGPVLTVRLDGQPALSAFDTAIPAGRVGLYSWGSQVVWFDDVLVRQGSAPSAPPGAVFHETFANGLGGWSVVDQGTVSPPSAWTVQDGVALQSSNIYGGTLNGADPNKPGTFLLGGDPSWSDGALALRMRNADNDGIGVMFRVANASNYYRFGMDSERSYRRLTKTVNGVTTTLAETAAGYAPNAWYSVVVRMLGPDLRVEIDGVPVLAAVDSTFAAGRIAPYVWGSTGASFDDIVFGPGGEPPALLAVHGTADAFGFEIAASTWAGRAYLLGLSLAAAPGIPLSAVTPSDPRVIPLAVDPLLVLSLQPNGFLSGFSGVLDPQGRASAGVSVPPGTLPSGFTLYASGIVLDAAALSGIAAVLPSLPVTVP